MPGLAVAPSPSQPRAAVRARPLGSDRRGRAAHVVRSATAATARSPVAGRTDWQAYPSSRASGPPPHGHGPNQRRIEVLCTRRDARRHRRHRRHHATDARDATDATTPGRAVPPVASVTSLRTRAAAVGVTLVPSVTLTPGDVTVDALDGACTCRCDGFITPGVRVLRTAGRLQADRCWREALGGGDGGGARARREPSDAVGRVG
jgi:hypothetical protein